MATKEQVALARRRIAIGDMDAYLYYEKDCYKRKDYQNFALHTKLAIYASADRAC